METISLPNPFDNLFQFYESIMDIMTSDEIPWDDYHHHSYFLPNIDNIMNYFSTIFLTQIVDNLEWPMSLLQSEYEKSVGNIYENFH